MGWWFPPMFVSAIFLRLYFDFPQYCEVREEGLFLRHGRKKKLIPFATIDKLLPIAKEFRWLPATNRYIVMPERGNTFIITVKEKEKFLAEVSTRCPKLVSKETKSGLSLQQAVL